MINILKRSLNRAIYRSRHYYLTLIAGKSTKIGFTCNICGWTGSAPIRLISGRETPSCRQCGSTLRFRAIVSVLTAELFSSAKSLRIADTYKNITGIGMSDSPLYANLLKEIFSYTNTFYHQEPKLDISDLSSWSTDPVDFLISSDVFEHIPISGLEKSFFNARKLLKKNGVLIFTVPYSVEGKTVEHFPTLNKWKLVKKNGTWLLKNILENGVEEEYSNLRFHGGEGATLEMRRFGIHDIFDRLSSAGFHDMKIHDVEQREIGIMYEVKDSFVISARA